MVNEVLARAAAQKKVALAATSSLTRTQLLKVIDIFFPNLIKLPKELYNYVS